MFFFFRSLFVFFFFSSFSRIYRKKVKSKRDGRAELIHTKQVNREGEGGRLLRRDGWLRGESGVANGGVSENRRRNEVNWGEEEREKDKVIRIPSIKENKLGGEKREEKRYPE